MEVLKKCVYEYIFGQVLINENYIISKILLINRYIVFFKNWYVVSNFYQMSNVKKFCWYDRHTSAMHNIDADKKGNFMSLFMPWLHKRVCLPILMSKTRYSFQNVPYIQLSRCRLRRLSFISKANVFTFFTEKFYEKHGFF